MIGYSYWVNGEQAKSCVYPDPWTLSCHKKFPEKPKNVQFPARNSGVFQALNSPILPLTLPVVSRYSSKGAL